MRAWASFFFAWACLLLALGIGPSAPWLAAVVTLVGMLTVVRGGRG